MFRTLLIAKIRLFPSLRYKKYFLLSFMEMVGIIVRRLNNPVIFVRVKFKKNLENMKFTNVEILLTLLLHNIHHSGQKLNFFPIHHVSFTAPIQTICYFVTCMISVEKLR